MDMYPSSLRTKQEIQSRLLLGHSQADIARDLKISRQRVNQIMKQYNMDYAGIIKDNNKKLVEPAVEMLLKGNTLAEAAKEVNLSPAGLKGALKKAEFDYEKIRKHAKAHKFDGRSFGYWTVLPGTYRRELREGNIQAAAYLTCVCDCGTVRDVMLGNLQSGMSRGCGCRNSNGQRKNTPWETVDNGQRITHPTSSSLARELGINYLVLTRRLNKGRNYVDKFGREWRPQLEKQTLHKAFKPSSQVKIEKIQVERIEEIMSDPNPDQTDVFAQTFFKKIWKDFTTLFR